MEHPKSYNHKLPLISIHIPKSAGSSFGKVLEAWFGDKFLRHYPDEKNGNLPVRHNLHRRIFRKRFKPGLCIHGHFNRYRGSGFEDYYPSVKQKITILRDPFEVHLSNYFYAKRKGDNARWMGKKSTIIEEQMDIADYLSKHERSYLRFFLPENLTIDNYQQIIQKDFIFIGIAEKLQESVDKLADILDYPRIDVPHENVSPRQEHIPDGAREEFIHNNQLEMAIYNYVIENFI